MRILCVCWLIVWPWVACGGSSEEPELDFVDPYVRAVEHEFNRDSAYQSVAFFSGFWRVAGNGGFDRCVEYIVDRLAAAGFDSTRQSDSVFTFRVDTSKLDAGFTWEAAAASFRITDARGQTVIADDLDEHPVMLVQHSFPVNQRAEVVDIGQGDRPDDYADRDVRRKIVFGSAPASDLFYHAVKKNGAAGVISMYVPPYNRAESNPDLIAYESIPRNEKLSSFALKVSRRSGEVLRAALARGPCAGYVNIETQFRAAPLKTVIAEIRGQDRPAERIVCVAHLDHYRPGANDNASGSATLLEMALAFRRSVDGGRLGVPKRTWTFLWVDEYKSDFESGGVGHWQTAYPFEFVKTKAAFSLDMVGEDTRKTGGVFRIEKFPDPSAVWTRPPDEHSGWGVSLIEPSTLRGSFINDYILAIAEAYAGPRSWKFRSNPFEGGSDHQAFVDARIPAVLAWHFPDQFYHSSGDSLGQVDPDEMQRVGTLVSAAALGLASLTNDQADLLLDLLYYRGLERMAGERQTSMQLIREGGSPERERKILGAWLQWYAEAIRSVAEISTETDQRLLARVSEVESLFALRAQSVIDTME